MKKAVLPLLLFALPLFLAAQESYLRHYSISEGVPSTETYWPFEDKQGYIWIASDMGVSRFDGYHFKVFTTADGLTDNTVFKFYQDYKGRIWFYTFSGRLSYYLNDTIYGKDFAVNNQVRDFLGSGLITSLRVDSTDTITMSTTKGVIQLLPALENGKRVWNKVQVITNKKSYLTKNGYMSIEDDGQSACRLTIHIPGWIPGSMLIKYPIGGMIYMEQAGDGNLYLYYNTTTFRIDSSGKMSSYPNLDHIINSFHEKDGSAWMSVIHNGVRLFKNNDFSGSTRSLLPSLTVTGVLRDRENGYWFTTLENGVFYLASTAFTYFPPVEDQLIHNETSLCVPGKNRVWVITLDEIYQSVGLDSFRPILRELKRNGRFSIQLRYWNAQAHTDGNIWLSVNHGVMVLDSSANKLLKDISLIHPGDVSNDSRRVCEDSKGNVWSLNLSAFNKIDHVSGTALYAVQLPSRPETICEDYNGHILVGTVNGLYKWNGDSLHYMGYDNPVFRNRFVAVKKCDGKMIGATRGAGLFVLSADSIYHLTSANGLRSNMCRALFVDDSNVIWVATNNGLNAVRISEHPFKTEITSYGASDGLLSDDVSQVVKTGGYIWLLSKNGITAFNPDIAVLNKTPPLVYITGLKTDNESRPYDKKIELRYNTNFIAVNFVGLTWKNSGKQFYKYKLEGYDTLWNYTQSPSVQFTRLPPGSYRFLVSCINSSGVESVQPAVLAFTVNAPFYRKAWFSLALSLLSIVIVTLVAMFRVRQIRLREQLKTEVNRKIANLELQALRAQMNPHFIFNCLNAIQDFILKNEAEAAKYYLTSFSRLIRKTLENSRRQNISLKDEIEFLQLYLELERMRFTNKFSYRIEVDEGLKDQNIEIPSMIFQPFIENAVRHSKIGSLVNQGELAIKFSVTGNDLYCIIEDNGIGLKESLRIKSQEAQSRQSYALEIMKERVRTLNEVHRTNIRYTITDKSDEGKNETGTRVVIYIPLEG
jgi:ligand-binding sensor domain-containing protein